MIVIRFIRKPFMIMLSVIGMICILFSMNQINGTHTENDTRDSLVIAGFIPFYWMIFIVGGLIILTLAYVSVRKYLGQKARMKKRSQDRK